MKKNGIIFTIVIVIITAVITAFVNDLFVSKAKLIYSVNYITIDNQSFQQITVKNNGGKVAENLIIDVPDKIDDYYFDGYFSLDLSDSSRGTHFIYPRINATR